MIYLDHHSTTPLATEALQAMLPFFQEQFANAGSLTHAAGRHVGEMVSNSIAEVAHGIGAASDEIVVTSGATESNNLAVFGSCLHPRQKRRKIISVATEHKAMLDPLARMEKNGFEVELLPVADNLSESAGQVDLQQLSERIDDNTALVSIMLANNEIGTIQPLAEVAQLCRRHGAMLHSDATQAVGRIPVDVDELGVDLLSFSAHKFYGPKGVGGLFVRRRDRRVRLQSQIVGGGQQNNFRSGTLNSPGIVGMAAALQACLTGLTQEQQRVQILRDRLYGRLCDAIDNVVLNGPELRPAGDDAQTAKRLAGNLNCSFFPIEGQSLMLATPELAVSSGSACTSAEQKPSHVLLSIGLSEEQARSSLRFGIGRTNTEAEIDLVASWLAEAVSRLRKFL